MRRNRELLRRKPPVPASAGGLAPQRPWALRAEPVETRCCWHGPIRPLFAEVARYFALVDGVPEIRGAPHHRCRGPAPLRRSPARPRPSGVPFHADQTISATATLSAAHGSRNMKVIDV